MEKQMKTTGLRGQVAGSTALSTVGGAGNSLTYCGYSIEDLAQKASFEEVVWLLFYGKLPTQQALLDYQDTLKSQRDIPAPLITCLELLPKTTHPMEVLRSACSLLGNLEPEKSFKNQIQAATRLLAVMPSMLLYWYHFSHHNIRINPVTQDNSTAAHFLNLLHHQSPHPDTVKCLNTSFILYAEHEFNASTFTARVCAATLSDFYSCITGAIGSLRGPLHGAANEEAMALIESFKDANDAEKGILDKLDKKELIMGFGHAIYRESDPRNAIIKACSKKLSMQSNNPNYYLISERIEQVMWREKRLFANADFFHASAYHFLNIPVLLFTPIFVCARLSGWAAHIMEQRKNNRLIRPSAEYIGPPLKDWINLEAR
ncbi:MAG: 2-methylcitrate synthase [Endozoicomonadaceae bacterium]|nr:2-methylcitrate synthase [Endozoicomonadaceae bacterium]